MDDTVVAVVEREFGEPPGAVERVEAGLLHETYRVRVRADEYVVQFSRQTDDQDDDLDRGLGCYRLLADSPVPVPRVVTDEVRTLDGVAYTVVEALSGENIDTDPTPERARAAGRALARLHAATSFEVAGRIRFEAGEPVVDPFERGLRGRIFDGLDERLARLRRERLTAAADASAQFLERHGESLPKEFRPVLCHGDFSPDNLLFEGSTLTGIIDFDRARASDPLRDLARAGNACWMHEPAADWDVRGTLYNGYRAVRKPAASPDDVEPLYRVETLVQTLAGMAELDEFTPYEREFYDEHVPRVVADAEETLRG